MDHCGTVLTFDGLLYCVHLVVGLLFCPVFPWTAVLCSPFPRTTVTQSFDRLGRRADMKDDSVEILIQSFLWEAIVRVLGWIGTSVFRRCSSTVQHCTVHSADGHQCCRGITVFCSPLCCLSMDHCTVHSADGQR